MPETIYAEDTAVVSGIFLCNKTFRRPPCLHRQSFVSLRNGGIQYHLQDSRQLCCARQSNKFPAEL